MTQDRHVIGPFTQAQLLAIKASGFVMSVFKPWKTGLKYPTNGTRECWRRQRQMARAA